LLKNFTIQNKVENGFDKIALKDESSGTLAEVIPSCGAILHCFTVSSNGNKLNVIDSYQSAEDFKINVTSKGFLGCKLSPFVCRLNKGKYNFAGKNYEIKKFYLDNHAIHGLIYNQAFTEIHRNVSDEKASVTIVYSYAAFDAGYPFYYDCVVTYELEKENKLNVITEIINNNEETIPIQDGWHPYFKLDAKVDDLQIKFQSKEIVEFNKELIPTGMLAKYEDFSSLRYLGETSFDNCFALNKLSGGEKRRLHLLSVLFLNPNFLVLDEPTNDLDLQTLRTLEEFLKEFPGCILIVSHDRYFMDRVVDHLFAFEGNGVIKDFPGNYSEYRKWKEKLPAAGLQMPEKKETLLTNKSEINNEKLKLSFKEKSEFELLEKELPELQNEKVTLEETMSSGNLEFYKLQQASERIDEIMKILDEKEMRWLELSERI
jgi:galactose mutarotase-like enzyme